MPLCLDHYNLSESVQFHPVPAPVARCHRPSSRRPRPTSEKHIRRTGKSAARAIKLVILCPINEHRFLERYSTVLVNTVYQLVMGIPSRGRLTDGWGK